MRTISPPPIVYQSRADSQGRAAEIWDESNKEWVLDLAQAQVTLAWGPCDSAPTDWRRPDEFVPANAADSLPMAVAVLLVNGLVVGQNYWLWARVEWAAGQFDIVRVEGSEVAVR